MNTNALIISPHKCSVDYNGDNRSSYTIKSAKSQHSVFKSPVSSGAYSSKSLKGRHKVNSNTSSAKSMNGEDIFPDYAVNWGSKNKVAWSKKEMNFGSSPKKETGESVIIIDTHTKSDMQTLSDMEIKSEEESKDIRSREDLHDISESFHYFLKYIIYISLIFTKFI